jgi:hypothetical protein
LKFSALSTIGGKHIIVKIRIYGGNFFVSNSTKMVRKKTSLKLKDQIKSILNKSLTLLVNVIVGKANLEEVMEINHQIYTMLLVVVDFVDELESM